MGKCSKKERMEREIKKIELPKPGEMVDTTQALCSICRYHTSVGGNAYYFCDYFLMTNKMRDCKCGKCDKFEKGASKKDHKSMNF
jgi:hypothetical protein